MMQKVDAVSSQHKSSPSLRWCLPLKLHYAAFTITSSCPDASCTVSLHASCDQTLWTHVTWIHDANNCVLYFLLLPLPKPSITQCSRLSVLDKPCIADQQIMRSYQASIRCPSHIRTSYSLDIYIKRSTANNQTDIYSYWHCLIVQRNMTVV